MKIIDSHVHFGLEDFKISESSFHYNLNNDYPSFLKIMDDNGVDFCCGLPIPDMGYDSNKNNEYLLSAMLNSNGRILPIVRFDDFLVENIFNGFKGAKYHVVYEKIPSSSLYLYYKILEYYKRPLIIHAAFLDKPKQIKKILRVAPKLDIILAHMGRGHIYESDMVLENVKKLKNYDNVYFETSTVGNYQTILDAIKIVGSNRILFGTDYPFGKIYFTKGYTYREEIKSFCSFFDNGTLQDIFYNTSKKLFLDQKPLPKISVVIMKPCYLNILKKKLLEMSEIDKKFLSFNDKRGSILKDLNSCKHTFAILEKDKLVGYMRESGRLHNIHVLEEIYIFPEERGKGISKFALEFFCNIFPNIIAKTFSNNEKIIRLFTSFGFEMSFGTRILNWTYGKVE